MFNGCWGFFFGPPSSDTSKRRYWTAGNVRSTLVKIKKSNIENDYRLFPEEQLGKGGCGIVITGENKKGKSKKFAIKIVEKKDIERVRFDRELKLLKEVDHTNIVRLFSVYDSSAKFYFVMELCAGGHLGQYITKQNNGYINEIVAKGIFRQLMSAIVHMHCRGIAHRDIKLQNILLDQDSGPNVQIKLIDFGFGSKFLGALPMKSNVGTLYTTAPEVLKECYDERCDVWSAGVVLYIMLSGKRPFENYDAKGEITGCKADIIENILAARYHFKHPAWSKVSRVGISYVKSLLHKDYLTRDHSSTAIDHPWFDNAPLKTVNKAASLKAVLNMKRLLLSLETGSEEIVQTGMIIAAFSLNSTSADDLRVMFQSFDTDNSGSLSKEEFSAAVQHLAPELTKADMDNLFKIIDIDNNGSITYTEFLAATLDPKELDVMDLRQAFNLMDDDGNGSITKKELYTVVKNTMEQAFENSIKNEQQVHNTDNRSKGISRAAAPSAYQTDALDGHQSTSGKNQQRSLAARKSFDAALRTPNRRSSSNFDSVKSLKTFSSFPTSKDDMEKMIFDKVDRIFAQVDKNNDGVISESEFLWAMTGQDYHMKTGDDIGAGAGGAVRRSPSKRDSSSMMRKKGSSTLGLGVSSKVMAVEDFFT